jgi:hypothetical protein
MFADMMHPHRGHDTTGWDRHTMAMDQRLIGFGCHAIVAG